MGILRMRRRPLAAPSFPQPNLGTYVGSNTPYPAGDKFRLAYVYFNGSASTAFIILPILASPLPQRCAK